MADSDNHIVLVRDELTKKKLLASGFPSDIVVHDFLDGKLRMYALTEGTIAIVNTGAATDTIVIKDAASLFSFQHNAAFNATIQNESKNKQAFIGVVFSVDLTKTSPDTDAGSTKITLEMRHRSGGAPTYSQYGYQKQKYELESYVVVEAAGIATLPYCGPFIYDFHDPVILERNKSVLEYIGATVMMHRTTTDRPTLTAHTAVTTYTLKVYAHAVLCDIAILKKFSSLEELWNQFMKGG